MAGESVPPNGSAVVDHEVQKLRNTVEMMDALAQDGFSKIRAVARLALTSMETPDGYRNLEDVAVALSAIWNKADYIAECVACEATDVGCHHIDDAWRRRFGAHGAYEDARERGSGALTNGKAPRASTSSDLNAPCGGMQ